MHTKRLTIIHTQLQHYTQDNYNNTHNTTKIHTRELTTIHIKRLEQYTQHNQKQYKHTELYNYTNFLPHNGMASPKQKNMKRLNIFLAQFRDTDKCHSPKQ